MKWKLHYGKIPATSSLYFDSNLQIGLLIRQKSVSSRNWAGSISELESLAKGIPESFDERKKLVQEIEFNIAYVKYDFEQYSEALNYLTKKYKIEATPTLIINGEKFENASNYKKLKKYLEKLI